MVKVEAVSFRANETQDAMAKRALELVQTNAISSTAGPVNLTDTVDIKNNKTEHFKSLLNDKNWKKSYSPETNLVYIKNKNFSDKPQYTITQDGTIREFNSGNAPVTILEQNTEASKIFNQIKEKKPFTLKRAIAGIWKFFSVTNQMVKSTIQGLVYGAVTGAAFLGGSWLFSSLPKAFTKEGPKLLDVIRHPIKNIGKSGKILAGVAAAAVFAGNIILGKLQANQNTAVIDHKIYTGHRDK